MHLIQTELSWAAGFWDGEGCTSAGRGVPMVVITQAERYTLDRFMAAVGGVGAIYGPYHYESKQFKSTQPIWHYRAVKFEDAQAVLAMLWKYLSPSKREQAHAIFLKYRRYVKQKPSLRNGGIICMNGHDVTGVNLYVHPKRGTRHCRQCRKEYSAKRRATLTVAA